VNALGGNDRIVISPQVSQDTEVNAGDGNDRVRTAGGNDLVDGGAGRDRIHTGKGDDTVLGGDNADVILGGKGDDVIDGGDGNDRLFAGRGEDVVSGGLGDDVLVGNAEDDLLDGGEGENRIIDTSQRDRSVRPREIVRGRRQVEHNPERAFNRFDRNDDELITQDEVSENLWSRLGNADTDDVEGVSLAELLDWLDARDRDRPRGNRQGDGGGGNNGDGDGDGEMPTV